MSGLREYRVTLRDYQEAWIGELGLEVESWLPELAWTSSFPEGWELSGELVEFRFARSAFGAALDMLDEYLGFRRKRIRDLDGPEWLIRSLERPVLAEGLQPSGPSTWRIDFAYQYIEINVLEERSES
jgi:hypothetical protein